MNARAIAEVRQVEGKWVVTTERPGSTMRIGHSFDTEDEAVEYANIFLLEYRLAQR